MALKKKTALGDGESWLKGPRSMDGAKTVPDELEEYDDPAEEQAEGDEQEEAQEETTIEQISGTLDELESALDSEDLEHAKELVQQVRSELESFHSEE